MKKTILVCLLILHSLSPLQAWGGTLTNELTEENQKNALYVLESGTTIQNLSSNGRYVVGSNLTEENKSAFLWDLEKISDEDNGKKYLIDTAYESHGQDVSNDGIVVGTLKNPDYVINEMSESSFVWQNNGWKTLGLGLLTNEDLTNGNILSFPKPYGIIADGQTIIGEAFQKRSYSPVPYSWKKKDNNEWEGVEWEAPNLGFRITSIADNGIACGHGTLETAITGNKNRAIVWNSPTSYKIIAPDEIGYANKISSNGKYVALRLGGKPAFYDVEHDIITRIEETGDCTAINNEGTAVGYYTTLNGGRKGFVWNKNFGFLTLNNYVSTFAPNIEFDDIDFSPSSYYMDCPIAISNDGKTIAGYTGIMNMLLTKAWVLQIQEEMTFYIEPKNFSATVSIPDRNKVHLSWESPKESLYEVIGYKIYRNNEEVQYVNAETYSYIDTNAPDGNVNYEICAVYTAEKKSPRVNKAVFIYPTYELPFIDNFEYSDLTSNYWSTELGTEGIWHIDDTSYTGFKGFGLNYRIQGNGNEFSHILTSRPFDATSFDKIYISFLYRISASNALVEVGDVLYIEIFNESNPTDWVTINEIPVDKDLNIWQSIETDISNYIAGDVFRMRFRVQGTGKALAYILIDNFQIRSTTGGEAPKKLVAQNKSDGVHLSWQDPAGSYGLTYSNLHPTYAVGDSENIRFIGANKFDTKDLDNYKGLWLTSITTFFPGDISEQTIYKLVVFEGDNKIVEQELYEYYLLDWITFKLDEPLLITGEKELYIGIEAQNYGIDKYPIYADNSESVQEGKSNIYSIDNGKTWQSLSNTTVNHNWCIIANIREEETNDQEKAETVWGYYIYRNGVRITESIIEAQTFIDTTAEGENNDYAVRAYYNDLGWSDLSEELTVGINIIKKDDLLMIYPNPATDRFYIEGIESKANIIILDVSGRILQKQTIQKEESVSIHNLAAGMYVIQIQQEDKTYEKVLIKK